MYYWMLVNNTTGAIGTHSSTNSPLVSQTQNGVTTQIFDPELTLNGFLVVGPYDDAQNPMPSDFKSAYDNQQEYLYQNKAFVANPNWSSIQLANAKQGQISSLRAGYAQTMAGGFQATIGGTAHTFGWSTDDKANLNATQTAVAQSYLSYPIQYSDINGSPVTLSSATDLDTIEQTATKFFSAQHQQILTLIGQVQAQTSVPTTPVTWTPATY